ncbi:MAG: SDR family oxidoreductase [Rhodospirillaceae bacterium]|jgi:NAD(P)-dependent dehydrogenase (short-subunit alcohol dehydrogenase family)|nr:SDR family oxidoreductase [Rhodospirillaceae bacterium]MBT5240624.1 SDR family oxidoreductase [Rhodospirillaceae bacterium]MBT5564459.1 SDR family oxidoreductase [Rhodospirillaceae bacterium]MBT6089749.1 SDR family oxidoreductase [Rhodospirillaceae bacterium]MBT6959626.1 SDR family oxidoreductase [Rhodospirillaceae bacterium]
MLKLVQSSLIMLAVILPGLANAETILITGSNRGIGLGLAEAYAERGWRVIATARSPERADELNALDAKYDNLTVDELDVTDDSEIAALAVQYEGTPIDVLLNNAGVLGDVEKQNAQNIDYDEIKFIMDVNVYGPMKMAKAFLPHVAASKQKKILTMTSGLGSMALTQRLGRFYGYRMSKAAVNMAMRAMHADLKGEGYVIGLIAPGQVQTELLFASGFRGPGSITVDESVAGLLTVIDGVNAETVGLPVNYDGQAIPW